MKRSIALLICLLMMTVPLTGCLGGDDEESPETPETTPSLGDWDVYYVASSADLPNCNSDTLGRLYYVEADTGFQTCTSTGWSFIDLTGPAGADGTNGANGTNGADGADGQDGADGAPGTDGVDGHKAIAVTGSETAGANCANGGIKIEVGVDDNDDSALQASEIDYTSFICNGADGINGSTSVKTMLTSISIPSLSACDAGGRIVKQGLDNGDGGGFAQSGVLESGEVDYTTTFCNNYSIKLTKDINPDGPDIQANQKEAIGDTLYFAADGFDGIELWKTDGTSEGTVLVKDINDNIDWENGDSTPSWLTSVGNTLYFQADDGTNGIELWKSDGTANGTVMVKNINSGDAHSFCYSFTAVGNTLYFSASDGSTGHELWKSDGTATGTVMVKDIRSGSSGSYPSSLTAVGNTLYFQANDGTNGYELWKSDGTATGTVMVKDIYPGTLSSYPDYLTAVGNTLYFQAAGGDGIELWKSDGTEVGTVMVKDIYPGVGSSDPRYITAVGNTVYFKAGSSLNGYELWKSDGTASGTKMVKDINTGSSDSSPAFLTVLGNTLYFKADDGIHGSELWKSDGTEVGTVMVKDINSGSSASTIYTGGSSLVKFDNMLYFSATDGIHGMELWKSDGTASGTVMVEDYFPGGSGEAFVLMPPTQNILYFKLDNHLHMLGIEQEITFS